MVVSLFINVAAPLAPNTVDEAPDPNAAPASAPLPCWINTRIIKITANNMCIVSIAVCIVYLSQIVEQIAINFFAIRDAPPINNPSMCLVFIKSEAFSGDTLPP